MKTLIPLVYFVDMSLLDLLMLRYHGMPLKGTQVPGLAICMAKLTLDGVLSRPLCDLGLGSFCVFISF